MKPMKGVPLNLWLENHVETASDMVEWFVDDANAQLAPETILNSQSPVLRAGYQMGWSDAMQEVLRALSVGEAIEIRRVAQN